MWHCSFITRPDSTDTFTKLPLFIITLPLFSWNTEVQRQRGGQTGYTTKSNKIPLFEIYL